MDTEGGEVSSEQIWHIFSDEYLPARDVEDKWGVFELLGTQISSDMSGVVSLSAHVRIGDDRTDFTGSGNGPIAAFLDVLRVLGIDVQVRDYSEHALSAGGDALAAAYVECSFGAKVLWGVGIDPDISTASLKAIISAVNRSIRAGITRQPEAVAQPSA